MVDEYVDFYRFWSRFFNRADADYYSGSDYVTELSSQCDFSKIQTAICRAPKRLMNFTLNAPLVGICA